MKIVPNETIANFYARLNTASISYEFYKYSKDKAHLDQIILNAQPNLCEKLLLEKELTLVKSH